MTNEEAIEILSRPFNMKNVPQDILEVHRMAIEALKQEPCEDCISRQAAIDTIESWLICDDYNEAERHIMRAMQSVLYDLSSVTPKKKTSWYIAHGMYEDRFWCSCGFIKVMDSNMIEWKYCPCCGGAMIFEPQESEE